MASTATFLSTLATRSAATRTLRSAEPSGAKIVRLLPAQIGRMGRAAVLTARAAVSGTEKAQPAPSSKHERVVRVHSTQEFDDALKAAQNRLVVVEFAASDSEVESSSQGNFC